MTRAARSLTIALIARAWMRALADDEFARSTALVPPSSPRFWKCVLITLGLSSVRENRASEL